MDSKVNRVTARSVSKRPATLSLKEPAKKMEDSIPLLAPVSPLHRKIQAMHCPMSPVTPDLDIQYVCYYVTPKPQQIDALLDVAVNPQEIRNQVLHRPRSRSICYLQQLRATITYSPSRHAPVLPLTKVWCMRSLPANAHPRAASRLGGSQQNSRIYQSKFAHPSQRTC